jgi:hypothetical protein
MVDGVRGSDGERENQRGVDGGKNEYEKFKVCRIK